MNQESFKRKLSAILSADAVGYSRLMGDDDEATVRTLTAFRTAVSDLVQQFRGRIVDNPGDNILAEFTSVVDAVNCSVEIQRELAERNAELTENRRMLFRIGINLGDVIEEDGRIYGDGVNIAARVESLAEPEGICLSGRVYDQVANRLGLEYENLGKHQVKNISVPIRVYRVLSYPGAAAHRVVKAKENTQKSWRKNMITAAAAIFIVIAAGLIWQFQFREQPIEPASKEDMKFSLPDKPSIAVLPFDNMSGDPEQEYFSDGISEDIITALSKTSKMFVTARKSTFTYKGKSVNVQEVGRDLGVRYILEGSVRKSEDRVRITAQLIDAITGHHLWADKYDRDLKDIFRIQDEITKKIITELHVELDEGEQARFGSKGTDNLEAYLTVKQARWLSHLGSRENNIKAQQLAEEAIAMAPDYAYAYRVLGITHIMDFYLGISESPKKSIRRAMESYKKAIALDEYLSSAYAGLGYVLVMMHKYDEAVRLGKKAFELGPNSADVINTYAAILTYDGKWKEAIPLFRLSLRLNPKPPMIYYRFFGHALRLSGQYEEAVAWQKKAIQQAPNDLLSHIILATSASMGGFDQEARDAVKEILRIDPQFSVKRLTAPFKDKTHLKNACDALNKAGLNLDCDLFNDED